MTTPIPLDKIVSEADIPAALAGINRAIVSLQQVLVEVRDVVEHQRSLSNQDSLLVRGLTPIVARHEEEIGKLKLRVAKIEGTLEIGRVA